MLNHFIIGSTSFFFSQFSSSSSSRSFPENTDMPNPSTALTTGRNVLNPEKNLLKYDMQEQHKIVENCIVRITKKLIL
jgi:hypothetical protein